MPKSRRVSKKNKSLWAKIAAIFVVLFVAAWVLMPKEGDSVLGVSTSNMFGGGKTSGTGTSGGQTGCKPMISAITLSNPCKNGFKSVSYTCTNGTTGSSTDKCLSPQRALETAGKTCSKGSTCKPPKSGDQQQRGGMQGGTQQSGEDQQPQDNSSDQ